MKMKKIFLTLLAVFIMTSSVYAASPSLCLLDI